MRRPTLLTLAATAVATAILALCAGTAYAAPAPEAKNKAYEYNQEMEGIVAGTFLKPGTYRIKITPDDRGKGTVTIFKNKQRIVEVPCQIEKADQKFESNGVAYGRNAKGERVVQWLYLSSSEEKVVLLSPAEQP